MQQWIYDHLFLAIAIWGCICLVLFTTLTIWGIIKYNLPEKIDEDYIEEDRVYQSFLNS